MTDPFASPKGDPGTAFVAAFTGSCDGCGTDLETGEWVHVMNRKYFCERCWEEASGIEPW